MITMDSIIQYFGNIQKNSWVIKNGQTTTITFEIVNSMTRII